MLAPKISLLHLDDVSVVKTPSSVPFSLNFNGQTPAIMPVLDNTFGGVYVDIDLSSLAQDSEKFGVARTLMISCQFLDNTVQPGPLVISCQGTQHICILSPVFIAGAFEYSTLSAAIPVVCAKGSILRIAQIIDTNGLCKMKGNFSLLNYNVPAFVR